MNLHYLTDSIARGWRQLASRRIYMVMLIVVPVLFGFFFLDLLKVGLPLKVPVAVVDMDDSPLSRQVTRNLGSTELVDVRCKVESFHEAQKKVRSGEIFGFFYLPEQFQKKALGGDEPTVTYYSNLTYYVPGSLAFKGFKTVAVTTTGALVQTTLVSTGIDSNTTKSLLQPVAIQQQAPGNPWMNYSIYLSPSFMAAFLALIILGVTVYSICSEIKYGTSPQWLRTAGGSMFIALTGKLVPQTFIEICVGMAYLGMMFGIESFPCNNHFSHLVLAMVLMVIACQAFAVAVCCVVPNLRLALIVVSLMGILSFSIAGFSFPVQNMYGSIGILSYILPVRYFFLIYIDQALNGIPLYFSRFYFVALLIFPLVALPGMGRLRKRCLNPIYVP